MLKKFIISQIAKIKVSHSIPGRIRFKVNSMKMIPDEYKEYQKFLFEALEKLDGVTNVEINLVTGSILVNYDINKLYEKKVLKWVDTIKSVGINNYDVIEKYGDTNLDFVIKTINQQLDEAVKNI
ncbi:HMA2 domain-containing protein [uncultured Clostridium sp.]|uniref:HMA2 domain-containing protein n=1 Tax=uncultured Clostridium sp. TaxID=59620 RepID=UPI002632986B|nr:cation transporter [uncultured Clostridium sp.]